jgi:hypothetical protein
LRLNNKNEVIILKITLKSKLERIKVLKPITVICCSLFLMAACSKATPVPVGDCDKVIKHATKVLGSNAPSQSKMKKQCKVATDEARGCVMAADKPMKILQCDF